ncbi:hypothetical protein D3C85_1340980 [compost metagenome]
MKHYILIILFSLSAPLNASSETEESDCTVLNQSSMNQCMGVKAGRASDKVNELYEEQMAYLTDTQQKELLFKSQQAWLKYRDAACNYVAGPEESRGTMGGFLWADCITEQSRQRESTLKGYIMCRENGCPY